MWTVHYMCLSVFWQYLRKKYPACSICYCYPNSKALRRCKLGSSCRQSASPSNSPARTSSVCDQLLVKSRLQIQGKYTQEKSYRMERSRIFPSRIGQVDENLGFEHLLRTSKVQSPCSSPIDSTQHVSWRHFLPQGTFVGQGLAIGIAKCGSKVGHVEKWALNTSSWLWTFIHLNAFFHPWVPFKEGT